MERANAWWRWWASFIVLFAIIAVSPWANAESTNNQTSEMEGDVGGFVGFGRSGGGGSRMATSGPVSPTYSVLPRESRVGAGHYSNPMSSFERTMQVST